MMVCFYLFQGARLPITVQEIINLPMDEFNDLLSKHELSEDQLALCKDIRRRGKNRVRCSAGFYLTVTEKLKAQKLKP